MLTSLPSWQVRPWPGPRLSGMPKLPVAVVTFLLRASSSRYSITLSPVDRLLTLRQITHSAAEYAIQFRTPAAGSGWNDEALVVCFENGLSEELKDELATRDPVYSLERLIDQVILLGNRLRQRRIPRPNTPQSFLQHFTSSLVPLESPEPMQLGNSPDEFPSLPILWTSF